MMVSSMSSSPFTAGSRLVGARHSRGWFQNQWVQGFPELAMVFQNLGGKGLNKVWRLAIELSPGPFGQGRVLPGQDVEHPWIILPGAGRQSADCQCRLFRFTDRGDLEKTAGEHNQAEAKRVQGSVHCSLRSRSAIQPATSLSSSPVNAR